MQKGFILFWEEGVEGFRGGDELGGAVVREMFEEFTPYDGEEDRSFIDMVVLAHSLNEAELEELAEKLNSIRGLSDCADAVAEYVRLTA